MAKIGIFWIDFIFNTAVHWLFAWARFLGITVNAVAPGLVDLGVFATDKPAFHFGGITRAALMPDQRAPLDDTGLIRQATREFFIPFVTMRDTQKGYAVSLIKAGADLVGYPGGDVRAPLTMPKEKERATLKQLIDKASSL